ncbi:MAG: MltA domain-containing protein, partial [Pseudomonadota bacterium]
MATPQSQGLPAHLTRAEFTDLAGWANDDQHKAVAAFRRFCENAASFGSSDLPGYDAANLNALCRLAAEPDPETPGGARRFFEGRFTAYRIADPGFVTGYFEPEVAASRIRTDGFQVPLHRKPAGLEAIAAENRPSDWPPELSHGRRTGNGLSEMPDRA